MGVYLFLQVLYFLVYLLQVRDLQGLRAFIILIIGHLFAELVQTLFFKSCLQTTIIKNIYIFIWLLVLRTSTLVLSCVVLSF